MLMITIRKARFEDLDFLVETDLLGDGYTIDPEEPPLAGEALAAHREKIAAFVGGAADCGWIAEDDRTGAKAGMILVRFRDLSHEADTEANRFLLRFLDRAIFPADGRFCEVFQLWVAPLYRRQGIATRLKQQIEEEARQRGVQMIYTHTEAQNAHVIELNRKLGYEEVRCGPIWDAVPRTSLVKRLNT
ncbi:MAG: GNAT family N-acetyltransferase, partial [Anaerolineaceae bacterium]|nr:GNAT family N-acetyltransferase [Anaerolineaceae bacterium]